jgi:hypothetical protein
LLGPMLHCIHFRNFHYTLHLFRYFVGPITIPYSFH